MRVGVSVCPCRHDVDFLDYIFLYRSLLTARLFLCKHAATKVFASSLLISTQRDGQWNRSARDTVGEKLGGGEKRGGGREGETVGECHGTGGILWRDAFETTFTFPISVSRHASALNWTEKVPYMLYHHELDYKTLKRSRVLSREAWLRRCFESWRRAFMIRHRQQ